MARRSIAGHCKAQVKLFLGTLNNIFQLFSCILLCVRCGSVNTPKWCRCPEMICRLSTEEENEEVKRERTEDGSYALFSRFTASPIYCTWCAGPADVGKDARFAVAAAFLCAAADVR